MKQNDLWRIIERIAISAMLSTFFLIQLYFAVFSKNVPQTIGFGTGTIVSVLSGLIMYTDYRTHMIERDLYQNYRSRAVSAESRIIELSNHLSGMGNGNSRWN